MTCKDRLPDLRRRARASARPLDGGDGGGEGDGCALPPPAHHHEVQEIMEEAARVWGWVRRVRAGTAEVRRLHADAALGGATLPGREDALLTEANALGLKVCGALRQLEARGGAAGALGARVARVQAAALRRAYAEALHEHHAALQLLRDRNLRLMHHQIKLTNADISEEECERLLDHNHVALFVDNVEAQTAEARRALRAAEEQRGELARVEAALGEVHALFAQLAALVAAQQHSLDTIEYLALHASERVDTGQQHLLKGTVSRRKARNKKISLIVCLTCGFLVVLLVLVYT